MIRVVFDTNVLFSAALKRVGIPSQIVDLIAEGVLTPCISDPIMAEYLDVLTRPVLRPHADRVRELLASMTKFAIHVTPVTKLSFCSDPSDERFLECAVAAEAAYPVTAIYATFRRASARFHCYAAATPSVSCRRCILDSLMFLAFSLNFSILQLRHPIT